MKTGKSTHTPVAASPSVSYVPPAVTELGSLHAMTLWCDKRYGRSDGFTFQGSSITCASA
jgi:hypothetical protein